MDIKRKAKDFLIKLRSMSDVKKKIVLWTIVAIAAAVMGYFWVRETISNFQKIGLGIEQIKMPNTNQTSSTDILQTTTPSDGNPIVQNSSNETTNWQIYSNSQYGIVISFPDGWSAGISSLFPNSVLFCPPELSSVDPDVICKLKNNVGHADTQAPIIFSLIQNKLQQANKSEEYTPIFETMNKNIILKK